jgi:hypothetical protein
VTNKGIINVHWEAQSWRGWTTTKTASNFCVPGSPGTHESVRTGAEQSTKYGKAGYNSFKKLK